jgi:hypothetical protein
MKQMTQHLPAHFEPNYQRLLDSLKLGGMQPKTIDLYSRAPCVRLVVASKN